MSIRFTDWVIEQQEEGKIESYEEHFREYTKENSNATDEEADHYAREQVAREEYDTPCDYDEDPKKGIKEFFKSFGLGDLLNKRKREANNYFDRFFK